MDTISNNLVSELRRFERFSDLRRSPFYRDHKEELDRLLKQPRIYTQLNAQPVLKSFLRIVQWNILYGSRLSGIISTLQHHPLLRYADVLLLNEVDDGTSRSGGVDVARELSAALSAHAVYGVEYLELSPDSSPSAPSGSDTAPLHGNAILTRHRVRNAEVVRLPRCENNFESNQKRLGGRAGLIADLDVFGHTVTVSTAHLDLVNAPRCRATQLRRLLEVLLTRNGANKESRGIVGGDFNTHTFERGTRLGSIKSVIRMLLANVDELRKSFLDPKSREPAFEELERYGFSTTGFNDGAATNRVMLEELERTSSIPGYLKRRILRRLEPCAPALEFRLDWLAGHGIKPLSDGEIEDSASGVRSRAATTVRIILPDGSPPSDHDPIVVDVAL